MKRVNLALGKTQVVKHWDTNPTKMQKKEKERNRLNDIYTCSGYRYSVSYTTRMQLRGRLR